MFLGVLGGKESKRGEEGRNGEKNKNETKAYLVYNH